MDQRFWCYQICGQRTRPQLGRLAGAESVSGYRFNEMPTDKSRERRDKCQEFESRMGIAVLQGLGGAAYRTRTCDPIITNDVLYQLS